jgi:hypothetical protein
MSSGLSRLGSVVADRHYYSKMTAGRGRRPTGVSSLNATACENSERAGRVNGCTIIYLASGEDIGGGAARREQGEKSHARCGQTSDC